MAYTVKFKYTKEEAGTPVAITGDFDNNLATELQSAQDAAGITQEWSVSDDGRVNEWIYTSPSEAVWKQFCIDHLHPAIAEQNNVFSEMQKENTVNGIQIDVIIIDEEGVETVNEFGDPDTVINALANS